jgi:hypothetical protein
MAVVERVGVAELTKQGEFIDGLVGGGKISHDRLELIHSLDEIGHGPSARAMATMTAPMATMTTTVTTTVATNRKLHHKRSVTVTGLVWSNSVSKCLEQQAHHASIAHIATAIMDGRQSTVTSGMTVLHYDIEEQTHRRAKMRAAARGITLRAWIVEAIEAQIEREEAAEAKAAPRRRSPGQRGP